ncbi:hypothetical protein PROFUN_07432 [Planoprotostelium fungivorum]|uniref:Uncharacterized protein n=1 Tax=Planoprotostelium fungivorum TaxID=1890364 RepID=A0A2P6NLJ5_9EUKA|nr:hypothetical protein PROFUN_07432 [Planoprotostelium fungivorum]
MAIVQTQLKVERDDKRMHCVQTLRPARISGRNIADMLVRGLFLRYKAPLLWHKMSRARTTSTVLNTIRILDVLRKRTSIPRSHYVNPVLKLYYVRSVPPMGRSETDWIHLQATSEQLFDKMERFILQREELTE